MPELPVGQVICADCLDVMRGWPDGCIDAVITDIPYGVVNRPSGGYMVLDKGDADIETFDPVAFVDEVERIVSGSIYIFCSTEQVSALRARMVEHGLSTRLCIWEKPNVSPMNGQHLWLSNIECCVFGRKSNAVFNEHCSGCIWRCPTEQGQVHPTQKPDKLMRRLVAASTNPNDLVLDPCCGSGSTLTAAERLGRRWIGIDISEEYCAIARKRTAQKGLPL